MSPDVGLLHDPVEVGALGQRRQCREARADPIADLGGVEALAGGDRRQRQREGPGRREVEVVQVIGRGCPAAARGRGGELDQASGVPKSFGHDRASEHADQRLAGAGLRDERVVAVTVDAGDQPIGGLPQRLRHVEQDRVVGDEQRLPLARRRVVQPGSPPPGDRSVTVDR